MSVSFVSIYERSGGVHTVALHFIHLFDPLAKATAIARTLSAHHCRWFGVLIVRGRCFVKRGECFYTNGLSNELFSQWRRQRWLTIVHSEGDGDVGGFPEGCGNVDGDPVPALFDHAFVLCACVGGFLLMQRVW